MLENVTVIIPAHNRPERLQRLLDYYASTNINIIIPDSSEKQFTGQIKSPRVIYLHRPRMHFLKKVREILPMISTKYVLYCADDDFAVPEAISEITLFMDKNPKYSVVQGHYLTFTPSGNKIKFLPRYIRNHDNSITSSDPLERMRQGRAKYASLLYGVARTDIFQRIYSYCFDKTGELRFRNLFLAELFFNHAMLMNGKYATLPYFFSARERIPGSATETTVPAAVIRSSDKYRDEFYGYIKALSLMLSDISGLAADEAEKIIREIDMTPDDTAPATLKRRLVMFLSRHKSFGLLSRLAEWRYERKGIKAVSGLNSYPCTFSTPEKDRIIETIRQHPIN